MKYFILLLASCTILTSCVQVQSNPNIQITVKLSDSLSSEPIDGRMLLMLSTNAEEEPRFQINDGLNTQLIFGKNVEGLQPGDAVTFTSEDMGFPIENLDDIPDGEYQVQALLHVYETFNLSTGHTVKLPMDNGEGQQWNKSPGNIYNEPVSISIGNTFSTLQSVTIDKVIPPIEAPKDTEWIKHIKMKHV